MDLILALYRVEAQARQAQVVRTAAHRDLRQLHSAPVLARLRAWLEAQAPLHPPKGPLGQAISYALKQWDALSRFVSDERLPLGRVEHWRGDRKEWGVAVAGRLSRTARRCLNPLHDSVSSARSSNRTCGSPASGSHLRPYTPSPTAG